jgi:hypothetical protein
MLWPYSLILEYNEHPNKFILAWKFFFSRRVYAHVRCFNFYAKYFESFESLTQILSKMSNFCKPEES